MIKINLLSPLDKENLKWEKVNNLAVKNILWVLISQAILVGVFFSSIEYLKAKSEGATLRLAQINAEPETREIASIERALKQNQSRIGSIYEAQAGHVSWTILFENIAVIVPAGVRLEDIIVADEAEDAGKKPAQRNTEAAGGEGEGAGGAAQAEAKKYKIQLSGNAKTRELLLDFEEKLKTTPLFSDLEYDTGNYVKSADIDFRYVFYVQEKDLLR